MSYSATADVLPGESAAADKERGIRNYELRIKNINLKKRRKNGTLIRDFLLRT
jgi:hypothetical protein